MNKSTYTQKVTITYASTENETTGATGATAVAPKLLDTLTLF